jgi:hypothetical protein
MLQTDEVLAYLTAPHAVRAILEHLSLQGPVPRPADGTSPPDSHVSSRLSSRRWFTSPQVTRWKAPWW